MSAFTRKKARQRLVALTAQFYQQWEATVINLRVAIALGHDNMFLREIERESRVLLRKQRLILWRITAAGWGTQR